MKYLKFFESFFSETVFYRFSHVDLLGDKDEVIYQPKERKMIGPNDVNESLVKSGFPDKMRCVHFMNSLAFDPSYKGIYGENIYQIEVSEDSKLGWSFLIPINDWFYKSYQFQYTLSKNPIVRDILSSEYYDMSYYDDDIDDMRDILIECGFIGIGTLKDLRESDFFDKQPVFVWTNDSVKITPYIEKPKEPKVSKAYKKEQLLTKDDFLDLDIPLDQIVSFYSSDWGKKMKKIQPSVPFELGRQEALDLLKRWKNNL